MRHRVAQARASIKQAYAKHVDFKRRSGLMALLSFLVTFVVLRLLTLSIRNHWVPVGNVVTSSGLHIHHFVWGIFLLIALGFLLLLLEQARWHPWLAVPFGVGAALVIDEFALWLNLRDVYWTNEGRSSVDLAVAFAALLAIYYVAERFWRHIVIETTRLLRDILGRGARRGAGGGGR